MRKTVLLFLPLLLIGCDKTYDEIVDTSPNNYQVYSVSPTDSIRYITGDSVFTFKINFRLNSIVGDVFCSVTASDGSQITETNLQLFDNGNAANGDNTPNDKVYSNKLSLSKYYPNGYYTTKYFVEGKDNELSQVAIAKFKYNNGQDNLAPIIANTIIDPDTIVVTTTIPILSSVEVNDPNGKSDIAKVFFIVYKPDGSTNNSELELFDDGNFDDHGDQHAGDGIYSRIIRVDETNDKGSYRFQFNARDRSGELSNTINHIVLIQ